MRKFAETCELIAGTTKKLEKTRIVAEYLNSRPMEEASVSAVFLSGKPFPAYEEATLQVGGRLLWQFVGELSGKSDVAMTEAYRKFGDLGAAAGDVLSGHIPLVEFEPSVARSKQTGASAPTQAVHDLSVQEVEAYF